MAGAGVSGHVIIMRIAVLKTFGNKPFKAAVAVFIPVPVQEIVAHLIYHNAYYQLGPVERFAFGLREKR